MIKTYLNLFRVRQWYKNLVIFLALFFSGHLLILPQILMTTYGFFSLSFISSASYILNDLIDIEKDRMHPEKKFRALASRKVSVITAIILGILLLCAGLAIAWQLNTQFFFLALGLFIVQVIYTFLLKNILFVDILTIATLFVIRATSGAQIISVDVSPWLILCPFFLSLFMSVGKRHADVDLLKEKANSTRKVLAGYTSTITTQLMLMSTVLLIISYAMYAIVAQAQGLIITLPFALYTIFRYYYLISIGSPIARHPEQALKDKSLVIGVVLWSIVTLWVLYLQ